MTPEHKARPVCHYCGDISDLAQRDNRIAELERLITATHKAKGRYHSQLAMCALYDAVGLPNMRPNGCDAADPTKDPVDEIRAEWARELK